MTVNTNDEKLKITELIQAGIAALKSGRKEDAVFLLGQAVEADPQSEQGWLWLSGAVDTDEERRFCLTQVLSLNKSSSAAQKGLKNLGPGPAYSPVALPAAAPEPEPPAAEVPLWAQWRDQAAPAEAAPEPPPPAAEAPVWSMWRDEAAPSEATPEPPPPAAETPVWSMWRDQAALSEAAPEPPPPAAETPVWSMWRDQATPTDAAMTPEPPAAETPAWSRWRDEAAPAEAVTVPEPPAAEAPGWSRLRQEAASTQPTRASLPKTWLIMTVILAACFIVGLLLLLLTSTGILGK